MWPGYILLLLIASSFGGSLSSINVDTDTAGRCVFCKSSCGGAYSVDGGGIAKSTSGVPLQQAQVFSPGCGGSSLEQTATLTNTRLCCKPESSTVSGTCRICTSCGGSYHYYGGQLAFQSTKPNNVVPYSRWSAWIDAYGSSCGSKVNNPTYKNSQGYYLCCKTAPLCSLCSWCGHYYNVRGGVIGIGGDSMYHRKFYKKWGARCTGSLSQNHGPGTTLCCMHSEWKFWHGDSPEAAPFKLFANLSQGIVNEHVPQGEDAEDFYSHSYLGFDQNDEIPFDLDIENDILDDYIDSLNEEEMDVPEPESESEPESEPEIEPSQSKGKPYERVKADKKKYPATRRIPRIARFDFDPAFDPAEDDEFTNEQEKSGQE